MTSTQVPPPVPSSVPPDPGEMTKNYRETFAPVPVDIFCASVNAGDLLFLSGSNFNSLLIKVGTWYEWTHVGVVDECPMSGTRFLWESQMDTDGCVDVLSRTSLKTGPRLVPLRERLALYAASSGRPAPTELGGIQGFRTVDVAIKRLTCTASQRRALIQNLQNVQNREGRKCFERSKLNMLRAQYGDFLGDNPKDTTEYFCSELVVQTLVSCGVVRDGPSPQVNCSAWTPKKIALSTERELPLTEGYQLGPDLCEYRVLVPPAPPKPE